MTDKAIQQQQPVQRSHYGKIEYWERRYSENNKAFDWYQTFDGVKDIITQYINHKSRILNVGCGNSTLSEDMFKQGYANITNVDYSRLAIEQMQLKYKDYPETFTYQLADLRELPFPDESFDCIIDKGTLDSVLCGEYSSQSSKKVLNHIHRVLTNRGIYIIISYGQPKYRLSYLEKVDYQKLIDNCKNTFDWSVTHYKVYKTDVITSNLDFNVHDPENYHYIYVCRRGSQTMGPGMQSFPKQS